MRILVAGDMHFQLDRFESLKDDLTNCDVLCLTGDYLDDKNSDREEQIAWVSSWLKSISKPIVMCSGNHDLDELAECSWIDELSSENIIIDDSVWTYQDVTFGVIPYIGAQHSTFKLCDILISHLPPSNTKTSVQDGCDYGDEELYFSITKGVIQPHYIFCGHVEYPESYVDQIDRIKIVNAGSRIQVINYP